MISVDIDSELVDQAREHLASAGYPDVTVADRGRRGGYPPGAPYDRVIATVGVSDLAPAWLHQTGPDARIVVPLDVRGSQSAVAFGRDRACGALGEPVDRAVRVHADARLDRRPRSTVLLAPGLYVMLPDGLTLADGQEVDGAALAAFLDGPPVFARPGSGAGPRQVFWGLGLWLATGDRASCGVAEERGAKEWPAEDRATGRLAGAPLRARGLARHRGDPGFRRHRGAHRGPARRPRDRRTAGVRPARAEGGRLRPAWPATRRRPRRARQAWDQAGQPGAARLHVDAYPRSSPDEPAPAGDALLIERPATRFVGLPHVALEA